MNKDDNSVNIMKAVSDSLENESLELIDFDQLHKVLADFQGESAKYKKARAELAFLKNEYCHRILGMLKAITVCRKDESNVELIGRVSGESENIDAAELVKIYNKTAVRFRSSFPASSKYVRFSNSVKTDKNWKEHKI